MHLMRHDHGTSDEQSGEHAHEDAHRARPPLAALLVEAGVATEEQLRLAASEGMATGERLGEVLLRRGLIDEPALARLLARQWDLPFDGSDGPVDEGATALLPQDEAERLGACPIAFDEGMPVVAIAEPTEERLSTVRETLQADARFVVVPRTRLQALLGRPLEAPVEEPVAEAPAEPVAEDAPAEQPAAPSDSEIQAALADLDAATASLAAVRERADRLAAAQRDAVQEIERTGVELDALRAAREQDRATIEDLQRQLAEQRERTETVRSKLAELTTALTDQ